MIYLASALITSIAFISVIYSFPHVASAISSQLSKNPAVRNSPVADRKLTQLPIYASFVLVGAVITIYGGGRIIGHYHDTATPLNSKEVVTKTEISVLDKATPRFYNEDANHAYLAQGKRTTYVINKAYVKDQTVVKYKNPPKVYQVLTHDDQGFNVREYSGPNVHILHDVKNGAPYVKTTGCTWKTGLLKHDLCVPSHPRVEIHLPKNSPIYNGLIVQGQSNAQIEYDPEGLREPTRYVDAHKQESAYIDTNVRSQVNVVIPDAGENP